ncbi:MAG: serine hydrolase [Deltaproteobacteria bacterium]|nr:serine hydrolase [Deltaproteobacteria bacterium]
MTEVHGFCDARFEPVRDAFLSNFERGVEVGACAAVTVDGVPVVDLWAGDAVQGGAPWQEDTIVNVYSTTKTMAAISVLVLADRGQVDLDAPVAEVWPEFAQNGKEGVLVRHVMSHSAGLSGFDPPLTSPTQLYDWDAIVRGLAAQAPWWTPGEGSGYHAVTQGFLQGEIVRQVTGKSIGTFFREEVAGPLGADFHIGLDPRHDARVGELVPPGAPPNAPTGEPDPIAARTMNSCPITGFEPRTAEWRRAEIPAAGGIGNARSVARVHSALACGGEVDGVRLMSEATVHRILDEQAAGKDKVMGVPMRYGMGFGLIDPATFPLSPNERSFFWGGWGGSIAVTDLDARMSVAYVMNRMDADLLGDVRGGSIVLSAYKALAA